MNSSIKKQSLVNKILFKCALPYFVDLNVGSNFDYEACFRVY